MISHLTMKRLLRFVFAISALCICSLACDEKNTDSEGGKADLDGVTYTDIRFLNGDEAVSIVLLQDDDESLTIPLAFVSDPSDKTPASKYIKTSVDKPELIGIVSVSSEAITIKPLSTPPIQENNAICIIKLTVGLKGTKLNKTLNVGLVPHPVSLKVSKRNSWGTNMEDNNFHFYNGKDTYALFDVEIGYSNGSTSNRIEDAINSCGLSASINGNNIRINSELDAEVYNLENPGQNTYYTLKLTSSLWTSPKYYYCRCYSPATSITVAFEKNPGGGIFNPGLTAGSTVELLLNTTYKMHIEVQPYPSAFQGVKLSVKEYLNDVFYVMDGSYFTLVNSNNTNTLRINKSFGTKKAYLIAESPALSEFYYIKITEK